MKKWESVIELHSHAKEAVNKQIKDLVKPETVQRYYAKPTNKGWIGNSIESDWFGLANNSRHEADFVELGVELKVTPIRKNKNKNRWSAKERLVLNIFDYNDEYDRQFENASFIEKAKLIELMYYEYIDDTPSPDFFIKAATLFDLHDIPEEDLLIIKQDWEKIVSYIRAGRAHDLSDSLTKYLGATTKGAKTEKNMTTQPFSNKKAHRRAFTLKGSYMSAIANSIMTQYTEPKYSESQVEEAEDYNLALVSEDSIVSERVIKNVDELKHKSFDEIVIEKFAPFVGRSKASLGKQFGINIPKKDDKSSSRMLAKKMLNIDNDIEETDEFKKAGIAVKIVTVNMNSLTRGKKQHKATEGFKLQNYFTFSELIQETWTESTLRNYLSETQFLLVIFEQHPDREIFKGVKFWSVPIQDLDGEIKSVWESTVNLLKTGVTLTYKIANNKTGYEIENNFIGMKDDRTLHVRPDAQVAQYCPRFIEYVEKNGKVRKIARNNSQHLPNAIIWKNLPENYDRKKISDNYMTRQAFWLNPQYMYQQVKDFF